MRRRSLLLCLALVGVPTTGCALAGDPCAAPVTGTATYVSGSTPPPYHVEWTVRLEESSGSVSLSPGYGSSQAWSAAFTPDAGAVSAACRTLHGVDTQATPTGGGTLTVRWRGDSGRSTRVTTSDVRAADAVRTAVPPDAWRQVEGAYERWRDAQR